jgi:ferric-dicitrate binding protein FerR (iron transport regulator)
VDVVDARAAVRAERAELQRVREERDHYHAEVQDLRRDVARLDRPWLDPEDEEEYDAPPAPRTRRRLPRVLVLILLVALLATGLEAGARLDLGALDLLALLGDGIASLFG